MTDDPAALGICVDLCVDAEPTARAGGLRALAASGRPDLAHAIRLFALRGDDDPGVLAEAFAGLLVLSTDDPVPFVAARLADDNLDVARAAAMALGDARRPGAIAALCGRLPGEPRPDVRHAIIVGLATSRDDEALEFLLALITRGAPADSTAASDALRVYVHDESLQRRVRAALDARRPDARPADPRRRSGAGSDPRESDREADR